jgi:ribonuclease P protein component
VKKKFGFSKKDKLSSAAYPRLLEGQNQTFISRAFVFVYRFDPALPHSALGLIMPKKKLKLAHDRNYAKRLNREYFRQYRPDLKPFELCVLLSRQAKSLRRTEWKLSLHQFWTHLKQESDAYSASC